MGWKLFLDDERDPVLPGWIVCRSVTDAVSVCEHYGLPEFISFDHDLGMEKPLDGYENTGMGFAKWMVDKILDKELALPGNFDFYVHSQNPIGAANIDKLLRSFLRTCSAN